MNIFDIFKTPAAPVAAAPAVAPVNQGGIPAASTVVTEPGQPNVPAVEPITPVVETEKDKSPLAQFKDLWDTKPNEEDKDAPAQPVPLTAEAVQKVMANADFSNTITPENLAAIEAGGEDAAKALPLILNAAIRQSMVQSTLINNKLNEKSIADAVAAVKSSLPDTLRNQSSSNHLNTANPLFSDPAIKPMVEAAHSMLLQKNPTDTDAQITKRVEEFVLAMGEAFTPKATDPAAAVDTDWGKFMQPQQ